MSGVVNYFPWHVVLVFGRSQKDHQKTSKLLTCFFQKWSTLTQNAPYFEGSQIIWYEKVYSQGKRNRQNKPQNIHPFLRVRWSQKLTPTWLINTIYENNIQELELREKKVRNIWPSTQQGRRLIKNYLLTFSSQSPFYENHLSNSLSLWLLVSLSQMCLIWLFYISTVCPI